VSLGVAAALVAWRFTPLQPPARRAAAAAVVGLALAAAGWPLQEGYHDDRYARPGPTLPRVSVWGARQLQHARVGIAGYLLQYPLYGTRLSNRVDVVGERGPHGAFRRFTSCRRWTRAVIAGRYRYLVTQPEGTIALGRPRAGPPPDAPETRWTRGMKGAAEIMRMPALGVSVFQLRDPRPGPCP
jgi:hypothetical protein